MITDPFVDIEKVVLEGLPGALTLPPGVTLSKGLYYPIKGTAPAGGATPVPFMQVELIDDVDDSITLTSDVAISFYDQTRARGYALAQQARGVLLGARRLGGTPIDRVRTVSGPKSVPWEHENIIRFLAIYRIQTRR